ncbi:MAG: class I mannose-6-phosphate isomerase [Hespellia sp.]|nr:class I mannose-6-phosphate isomerase [Hespellia sp.]
MMMFRMHPSYKEYLWGGTRLKQNFHKAYAGDTLAETWELSCHEDGPCYIAEGKYAGLTLNEYIRAEGRKVLGKQAERFEQFPILIKLIDAADDLSIQVHPGNEYALKNEHQYGKMEMWYIVDCEEGASVYYGFSREVSREEFEERIRNKTLLEVLNKVYVKKGDVLFIEPGTIHAIGKGNVIAEIQQNSNVTYRVYDYGRRDKNGKERDLHIDKALQVTQRIPIKNQKSFEPHIASCEYFTVDKLVLDGTIMKCMSGNVDSATFVSLLVIDGEGWIHAEGESIAFQKGDSLFVSADTGNYNIEGACEILITTLR